MQRGLDHQAIFYDDEDRIAFLYRLIRYKETCAFRVFAYALMENHVHLLLSFDEEIASNASGISDAMKRLFLSYAWYFNKRYDRQGFLFQGRFSSKSITSDSQLLATVCYIHNNPVEVGYKITDWTSYPELIEATDHKTLLTETELGRHASDYTLKGLNQGDLKAVDVTEALGALGLGTADRQGRTLQQALSIPPASGGEPGLDAGFYSAKRERMSDQDALNIILDILGSANPLDAKLLDRETRDDRLSEMKEMHLSVRQISRLTGITKSVVHKARPTS
ncbi:MAG: transposase [Coriobacteriia bacterium]|nr:transposase [Coriobacteriia bacterium]